MKRRERDGGSFVSVKYNETVSNQVQWKIGSNGYFCNKQTQTLCSGANTIFLREKCYVTRNNTIKGYISFHLKSSFFPHLATAIAMSAPSTILLELKGNLSNFRCSQTEHFIFISVHLSFSFFFRFFIISILVLVLVFATVGFWFIMK